MTTAAIIEVRKPVITRATTMNEAKVLIENKHGDAVRGALSVYCIGAPSPEIFHGFWGLYAYLGDNVKKFFLPPPQNKNIFLPFFASSNVSSALIREALHRLPTVVLKYGPHPVVTYHTVGRIKMQRYINTTQYKNVLVK